MIMAPLVHSAEGESLRFLQVGAGGGAIHSRADIDKKHVRSTSITESIDRHHATILLRTHAWLCTRSEEVANRGMHDGE